MSKLNMKSLRKGKLISLDGDKHIVRKTRANKIEEYRDNGEKDKAKQLLDRYMREKEF